MRDGYDPYSAVTFLMLGLGIGAVVAIVCSPRVQEGGGLERTSYRRHAGISTTRRGKSSGSVTERE